MLDIAQCESHQKQYKADGSLVKDYMTGDHIGLFQISRSLHGKEALRQGIDITTPEGNVAYALILYKKNGTQDWSASSKCWNLMASNTAAMDT